MFNEIPEGTYRIVEGVKCHIPPVGMGIHCETDEIQPVDIIKRSTKKEEQYWERPLLPKDFEKKVRAEKKRQEIEPDHTDHDLDEIRLKEWHRRLYGVWFWNNGQLVYLTGLHYFFMTYWKLATGYPDFRIIDLEKAYFWCMTVHDPTALAMLEVRKRRDGKSFFAGCIEYEIMSRTKGTVESGIVSYNKEAAEEFFSKTIVSPFKSLPSFFIPVWDTNSTLKSDIRFTRPSAKGKNNSLLNSDDNGEELGSYMTFMDSKPKAYDGHQTKVLVIDEVFKTEVDCFKRHLVVKYCAIDHTGKVVGKIIYTSTVEEIGVKHRGDKFWAVNDQMRRLPVPDSVKRSGEIYCFFMPAYRSGKYDKYGYCDEEAEKQRIIDSQRQYEGNDSDLIADRRKNPFDIVSAFRISSNTCHFNQSVLHDRIDEIGWADYIERGDLVWENGTQLTKVLWQPNKSGKFWVCKGWKFDNDKDYNNVIKRRNSFQPGNTSKMVAGLDGYDHDLTEDSRKSNAALYGFQRHNPIKISDPYDSAFIIEYVNRPAYATIMWDDVLKLCFYLGCQVLYENNKPGMKRYFYELGCSAFLVHLDDYKEPGIPATQGNKQTGVDIIEEYINRHLDKVYFKRLIQSWIKFNVNETQKEDETMGSMWTLYADRYKVMRRDTTQELRPITDYIKRYKIQVA